MIGVSHKTHNFTVESVIIMIGVLLGEMKSNEKIAPLNFDDTYNPRKFLIG